MKAINILSIFIITLIFSTASWSQEKTISGVVSYLETPISDVNIIIEGTTKGVKTNTDGSYVIQAKLGAIINYTHVGFNSVSIVIEDITSTLNVNLSPKANELETTVIKARKKVNSVAEFEKKMDVDLQTPSGTINPRKSGFSIQYISGGKINQGSPSIVDALNGKFAGLTKEGIFPNDRLLIRGSPASYIVDGIKRDQNTVPLGFIEDIYVVKNSAQVIIRTKNNIQVVKEDQEAKAEEHRNQNYYANDAAKIGQDGSLLKNSESQTFINSGKEKNIRGVISYLDAPIRDVNIRIKNTSQGTKTNRKGRYSIKAKVGDELEFSHVSYKTVFILVEDITEELNIDMIDNTNELNEVVITAKTANGKVLEYSKNAEESFSSSRGNFNPETAGYAVGFVDGKSISNTFSSIKQALVGKISGYYVDGPDGNAYLRGGNSSVTQDYPVAWEVDGVFTTDAPISLDLSEIKTVHALKSLAATNKYGTLGAGGIVVIETNQGNLGGRSAKLALETQKHTNKNYYSNDAVTIGDTEDSKSEILSTLENINNKELAVKTYEALDLKTIHFDEQISIAKVFKTQYNDDLQTGKVLLNIAKTYSKNSEILKAVAFNLQAFGLKKGAVDVYKMILKSRPNYAQSYRDLANAFKDNDQFTQSWRLYMSYLMQGHDVSGDGIGAIIYNEMEFLYFNRKNQTAIRESFVPKSENIQDFRNDVRLLFEWNTSEAEFDLEFVNPDLRAYVFEHSLAGNQELITKEKQNGFSSKEFIIDAIGDGEWLINLTYLGNKKSDPTFIKVTTYYHWGKSNQREEIKVYRLDIEHQKFQLIQLNKQLLIADN
jgi:hypothetical protein